MKQILRILTYGLAALYLFVFSISQALAAEPKRIVFAYSPVGSIATAVWMAKEIGAFEKYCIPCDIILFLRGP